MHSSTPDPCTLVHEGSALFGTPSITQEINSGINTGREHGKDGANAPRSFSLNSDPQKRKPGTDYESWLTNTLIPAFPIQGHCQNKSALRFLRKERPTPAQLAAYLEQVEQWKPAWVESGCYPGLHSFLTEGKYRHAPAQRTDRNGNYGSVRKGPSSPRLQTPDEYWKTQKQ
jgi:hypothetical protein